MPKSRTKKKAKKISPKGSGGVFGGGGGSSSPPSPTTANDSGRSNSYLSVLAGLSEGQIEGLVNGGQSIYLDNTPVLNSDGSSNFTGFEFDFRSGTQNQSYMPGYADSVNEEVTINTEVKQGQPIIRQILNKNLDILTVRLSLTLQSQDSAGNVSGTDIAFRIWIKEGLNAYRIAHDINISSAKYSTATEFEYPININNYSGTVDKFLLKVERITPTVPVGVSAVKTIYFSSFINSSVTKLSYPNTALVGLKFEASQFSSAPQAAFEIKGIIVDVPSNATVQDNGSVTYSGIWNGLFITPNKACSDPAWILWDLLTKKRYGLGRKINVTNLNRWKFLEISKYCNELVPDGFGGTENRFLSNFVLETAEDAYKVIETIRSIFHGMSYFLGGSMTFEGDFPGNYVQQFTQSDVENGMFSYARTGLKAVHNVAIVTWIDPTQGYTKQIETVEDHTSIIADGYKPTEVVAFGATSRGQARRAGLYILYSEKLNRETVTFNCRAIASNVFPTQIIKIADNKRNEIRNGGLIKNFARIDNTKFELELDYPVQLVLGETYNMSLLSEDGKIYDFPVSNLPGTTSKVNLAGSIVSNPAIEGNWILSSLNKKPQLYRVLNRVAVKGSQETMFEITALQYDPQKYAAIDFDTPLEPIVPKQSAPLVTNAPTNINITYNILGNYPSFTYVITGEWNRPFNNGQVDPFVTSYVVERKFRENGLWGNSQTVNTTQIEYTSLRSGFHYIRVASIDIYGKTSRWIESSGVFVGVGNSSANLSRVSNADFAMIVG